MARTIQNIFVTGGQTFSIKIDGLTPVTEVKLFFDGNLVPSNLVRQIISRPSIDFMGPVLEIPNYGTKLITDGNGAITIEFIYTDSIDKQNFTSEEEYYAYAERNTGPKTLILLDAATAATVTGPLNNTVSSDLLTQTLRKARCYASGTIQLSYGVSFIEIKPAPVAVYSSSMLYAGGDDIANGGRAGGLLVDREGRPIRATGGGFVVSGPFAGAPAVVAPPGTLTQVYFDASDYISESSLDGTTGVTEGFGAATGSVADVSGGQAPY